MRQAMLSIAAACALMMLPRTASSQTGPRGALVINGPRVVAGQPRVVIQVDGNPYSEQAYGRPMPFSTGKRVIYGLALDQDGRQALAKWEQIAFVHAGRITEVNVPPAIREADNALMAGGVVLTAFGALSIVASGFLFSIADAAGTDCHQDGFAKDACGLDPAPFVGTGVTTLLFGLAGIIGGPIVIANGAVPSVSFYTPEVALLPNGVRMRF